MVSVILTTFLNLLKLNSVICGDIFQIQLSDLSKGLQSSGQLKQVLREQGAFAVSGFPQVTQELRFNLNYCLIVKMKGIC